MEFIISFQVDFQRMKKLSKFYYTDNCHVTDFVGREQVGCAAVHIAWLNYLFTEYFLIKCRFSHRILGKRNTAVSANKQLK